MRLCPQNKTNKQRIIHWWFILPELWEIMQIYLALSERVGMSLGAWLWNCMLSLPPLSFIPPLLPFQLSSILCSFMDTMGSSFASHPWCLASGRPRTAGPSGHGGQPLKPGAKISLPCSFFPLRYFDTETERWQSSVLCSRIHVIAPILQITRHMFQVREHLSGLLLKNWACSFCCSSNKTVRFQDTTPVFRKRSKIL